MAFLYCIALILLGMNVWASVGLTVEAWAEWGAVKIGAPLMDATDYRQCEDKLRYRRLEALVRAWAHTILTAGYVLALVYVILSGV